MGAGDVASVVGGVSKDLLTRSDALVIIVILIGVICLLIGVIYLLHRYHVKQYADLVERQAGMLRERKTDRDDLMRVLARVEAGQDRQERFQCQARREP